MLVKLKKHIKPRDYIMFYIMTIFMFSIVFFIFKDSFYYSTIKNENQYFDIQSTIKEEIKIDFNKIGRAHV